MEGGLTTREKEPVAKILAPHTKEGKGERKSGEGSGKDVGEGTKKRGRECQERHWRGKGGRRHIVLMMAKGGGRYVPLKPDGGGGGGGKEKCLSVPVIILLWNAKVREGAKEYRDVMRTNGYDRRGERKR